MKIFFMPVVVAVVLLPGCNESRRGNDSNVFENRDEAAAESNTDKFAGKKQRDAEFVFEMVAANYGEIKFAELGNQRSRDARVKEIAQTMLTDHTASLNELKTLAQAQAISVPVEETNAARRKLEAMAEEPEEDFDRAWCNEMMDMHESAIDKLEQRLKDTENAGLKAYIEKTLPVLEGHHERLKACVERLKRTDA